MLKKNFIKMQSILLMLLFCVTIFPNNKAMAQTPPNPSSRYSYSYDSAISTISESLDGTATGRKFANPEKLSGELWKQSLPGAVTGTYVGDGGGTPSDEGFIAYQYVGKPEYYLIVRFKTTETMGLYKKAGTTDKYFYSWIYASNDGGKPSIHIMKAGGTGQFDVDSSVPADFVDYVGSVNGIYTSSTKTTGIGTGIKVSNLFPDKIPNNTKICGKATLDFTSSTFWSKLSDNDKQLAPQNVAKWPKDFLVAGATRSLDVPLYLQYKMGNTYVNASSATVSNGYVNIKNDDSGSWQIDMSGMPAGTYKLNPEFFLRYDNDDRNSVRPDTPTQGSYRDWAASRANREDDMEIFTSPAYEVTIDKDGNISDANAKSCNLVFSMVPRGTWNAGRLNNKDETCTSGNSGIQYLIMEALCGLTITLKNWADGLFKWAEGLMEQSIGIARNQGGNAPDDLPEFDISTGLNSPAVNSNGVSSNTNASTTAPTASSGDITYNSPIIQTASGYQAAAENTCEAAKRDNVDLSKQPCLIKNLTYTIYGSTNSLTQDTKAGIQIVNGGKPAMTDNFTKPNKCGVSKLIILKTDCKYSDIVGTPAGPK